ncbi:glutamine amidotransferase [Methylocapsa palsarum]|uniref:GMP synthase (Glutamine-hydrolysing) n=1 Tax=Methylocapsa palsarum TaxID=1612308 RepID=A0A1I3Z5T1_9HYPH|nr:glutamine amidotransferase [Methylocapsa palsarum]SFK39403.1 GMP synthase (glutamine-hydrolysing) [Methylocapsa palsarum]
MASRHDSSGRVLIILHQEHSTAGRLGRLLLTKGYQLDVRRPRFGDPLPATLCDHVGVIIFGGPMSVNDTDAWIRREIQWIETPLKEEKPLLGICLGAQMLATHLGHCVRPHPQGRVEVGYYPIHPTEQGHQVCDCRFPDRVYQWHREGFELPKGATLLASGKDFEAQAFRYGPAAYGLQFHPEVTLAMMCRWSMTCQDRMVSPGAHPRHRHLEGWLRHDRAIARWSNAFLGAWLSEGQAI